MSPFSFLSFPPPGGTLTKELVPNSLYQPGHKYSQHKVNVTKNTRSQGQCCEKLADYDVAQVQIVDHDLRDTHKHLLSLHPPVVT